MGDESGRISIASYELCGRPERQVQNVVENEYLAIALRSSANADRRRADFSRDHCGDLARNTFEVQACHSGPVQRYGISHKLFDSTQVLSLNLVAPHYVDGLRSQANMACDRNLRIDDVTNKIGSFLSTLDLHYFRSAFFHKAGRVDDGIFRVRVIRAVRHVRNEQCIL